MKIHEVMAAVVASAARTAHLHQIALSRWTGIGRVDYANLIGIARARGGRGKLPGEYSRETNCYGNQNYPDDAAHVVSYRPNRTCSSKYTRLLCRVSVARDRPWTGNRLAGVGFAASPAGLPARACRQRRERRRLRWRSPAARALVLSCLGDRKRKPGRPCHATRRDGDQQNRDPQPPTLAAAGAAPAEEAGHGVG